MYIIKFMIKIIDFLSLSYVSYAIKFQKYPIIIKNFIY